MAATKTERTPEHGNDYMSAKEVAQATGHSLQTVYRWRKQDTLPGVKLGRRVVRFRRADVEAFMAGKVFGVPEAPGQVRPEPMPADPPDDRIALSAGKAVESALEASDLDKIGFMLGEKLAESLLKGLASRIERVA